MKRFTAPLALAMLLVTGAASANGDAEAGKTKAVTLPGVSFRRRQRQSIRSIRASPANTPTTSPRRCTNTRTTSARTRS